MRLLIQIVALQSGKAKAPVRRVCKAETGVRLGLRGMLQRFSPWSKLLLT